jgi:WD40 repeat protein
MAPSRGPQALARTLHKTLSNHRGPVHVVRYAKGTAKYVLSGGQDRTVRLWNPDLGTEIKKFEAHGYEVLSISVLVISAVSWLLLELTNKTVYCVGVMTIQSLHLLEETALSSYGM